MVLSDEGTIAFVLQHEHQDWLTNDHAYNFGTIDTGQGVKVGVVKHPDKTLELRVSDPFGQEFNFLSKVTTRPFRHLRGQRESGVSIFLPIRQ